MILRMMKKSKEMLTVVCVLMIMLVATGCGENKETPIPVDLSSENMQDRDENSAQDGKDKESSQAQKDGQPEADDKDGQQMKGETDDKPQSVDDKSEDDDSQSNQTSGNEELKGDVYSVGQDSFVICKLTISSDNIAAVAAPGNEEADDLVTVYVNQNCAYKYETVKNGGINPEDVSSREGSFGDLQEGMTCFVKGSWHDGFFYADSIVMMKFV